MRHNVKYTILSRAEFQSTHPLRGATSAFAYCGFGIVFQSTHPLRGATIIFFNQFDFKFLFQSTHPLRGATKIAPRVIEPLDIFQSTHPLRGATLVLDNRYDKITISIHAPLAGCDTMSPCSLRDPQDFNPRTPCGVRHTTFP